MGFGSGNLARRQRLSAINLLAYCSRVRSGSQRSTLGGLHETVGLQVCHVANCHIAVRFRHFDAAGAVRHISSSHFGEELG